MHELEANFDRHCSKALVVVERKIRQVENTMCGRYETLLADLRHVKALVRCTIITNVSCSVLDCSSATLTDGIFTSPWQAQQSIIGCG